MPALINFAWLYWNPSAEAFTLPFIDRPVLWYGILFITGFLIGYFLFVNIFTKYLQTNKFLTTINIANWPQFIQNLQNPSAHSSSIVNKLIEKIPATLRKRLKAFSVGQPDLEIKNSLLEALNQLLSDGQIQRKDLEKAFPGIFSDKRTAYFLADRLLWFIVIGTLVGARLGHVLFYDWDLFSQHPVEVFKVWKGGLASHGGVLGVALALYLYLLSIRKWMPHLSFLRLLDFVAIPSALAACFIRLGNFMNQEIVGTPSNVPWAIVFGRAADGSLPIPRHPVQLYEALAYLISFFILFGLWKKKGTQLKEGFFVGLLFILIFSARFVLEFWKVQQTSIYDTSFLQMGQLLSVPFILVGFLLVLRHSCCSSHLQKSNQDGFNDIRKQN